MKWLAVLLLSLPLIECHSKQWQIQNFRQGKGEGGGGGLLLNAQLALHQFWSKKRGHAPDPPLTVKMPYILATKCCSNKLLFGCCTFFRMLTNPVPDTWSNCVPSQIQVLLMMHLTTM